jgi:hypothetical protein
MILLLPHPSPQLYRQKARLAIHRKKERKLGDERGGKRVGVEPNHATEERMIFYKSLNTLWCKPPLRIKFVNRAYRSLAGLLVRLRYHLWFRRQLFVRVCKTTSPLQAIYWGHSQLTNKSLTFALHK